MQMTIGLHLSHPAGRPGAAPAAPSPVTAIGAEGFTATYPDPPVFDPVTAPEAIAVTRPGFTPAGLATTRTDPVVIMTRLRQPYPDQATLTADQVSLSDFVFSGDTIPGVANASTRAYPKPIACWLTPDLQRATGARFTARLAVAHAYARAGQPVAAVRFIASDGTTEVDQLVSTMSARQWASGLSAPYFEAAIDLSALAPATLCTLDAIIYPWVGEAFRISTDADTWPSANLCVLKFLNDRTGSYGTAFAYVDAAGGSDGTGAVSTTPATAGAAPFQSVAAAASALRGFNLANFGRGEASGGTIRLIEGTHLHANFSDCAASTIPVTIEAADPAKKATTVYQDPGSSISGGVPPMVAFRNLTLRKAGGSTVFLDSAATLASLDHLVVMQNVTVDLNGTSAYAAWIYRVGRIFLEDCDMAGANAVFDDFGGTAKHITAVGCTGAGSKNTTFNIVASQVTAASGRVPGSTNLMRGEGQFFSHSHFTLSQDGTRVFDATGRGAIGPRGLAVVGCVIEQAGGDTNCAFGVSADGDVTAAENVLSIANTVVGSRTNWLYQDSGSSRVAKSGWMRFTVNMERNTKTDIFGQNGNLTGNWPAAFNCGHRGNAALMGDKAGNAACGTGAWLGEVAGPGDAYGAIATPLAADWADDQSFGAGGGGMGDYTPGAGSALPCVPAGLAPFPVDMKGRPVADDGSARVGAIQPA